MEEGKVLVFDSELRKELSLSTADLRFADFLIKHVSEKSQDLYLDNTGEDGGGFGGLRLSGYLQTKDVVAKSTISGFESHSLL